jgi:hypothetical protein
MNFQPRMDTDEHGFMNETAIRDMLIEKGWLNFENAQLKQPLFTRLTLPGFWREIKP